MRSIIFLSVVICAITACSNSKNKTEDSVNQRGEVISDNDTCRLIDSYLSTLVKENNFSGGLLIVKDGKKIFSKGYGWSDSQSKIPFTTSTLASIGSITKAFTATAILKLAEQNKLSLNDPLKKYFPAIPSDKADITIHQLLTHSSGFHEFLKNDQGDYEIIDTKNFLERAFNEPLAFSPGSKAVYTNVGFSILGIIIEQVSGVDYEKYLKQNLFEPLGITKIGYHFPVSSSDTIAIGYEDGKRWGTHQERFAKAGGGPFWNLKANGGLEVSLDEMFLWINSFTKHTILSETDIDKMFTAQIKEEGYEGRSFFGYGCNILQSRRNTKMIDNGGSNRVYFARIIRLPEEKVVFYMVTNESMINTNMVLPNITQLYFKGEIEQDAIKMQPRFQNELSKHIYDIVDSGTTDLGSSLSKENIKVDDDMILWEVGQLLMKEGKVSKALVLYKYYVNSFPEIVVAWNDLGDVYQKLNNKEEAIKCYKQALKIRPGNPRAKESLDLIEK